MINRLSLLALGFAVALPSAFATSTTTTDTLMLMSGASTVTVHDNGVGDTNSATGQITYSNSNFNGWDIQVAGGASYSPNLTPYGIDITALTAACNSGSCAPLTLEFSDINFTTKVGAGGFTTFLSSTLTGAASLTQTAYDDTTNTLFGTGTKIGTVGPMHSPGGAASASGGGPAGPRDYSLTLIDVLGGGANISYSLDGNITGPVPEPASLALIGVGLLGLAFAGKRRSAKK